MQYVTLITIIGLLSVGNSFYAGLRVIKSSFVNRLQIMQPLASPNPQDALVTGGLPLKTMIFMDGSWLFYSLINETTQKKFGENWKDNFYIDWVKLPGLIARNLQSQLRVMNSGRQDVEVARTLAFTSMRENTVADSPRSLMVDELRGANFDVYQYVTEGTHEKCVDINLAVDMLYTATVPGAYDIAVLVSGDKDFAPALQKTRMVGKRTAICSMKNSCSGDLVSPDWHTKDFDPVWLDHYLDDFILPRTHVLSRGRRSQVRAAVAVSSRSASITNAPGLLSPSWTETDADRVAEPELDEDQHIESSQKALGLDEAAVAVSADAMPMPMSLPMPATFSTEVMERATGESVLLAQLPLLTVKELVKECEVRDLFKSGNKSTLVSRLQQHWWAEERIYPASGPESVLESESESESESEFSRQVPVVASNINRDSEEQLDFGTSFSATTNSVGLQVIDLTQYGDLEDDLWIERLIINFIREQPAQEVNLRILGKWLMTIAMKEPLSLQSVHKYIKNNYLFLKSFFKSRKAFELLPSRNAQRRGEMVLTLAAGHC